MQAPFTQDQQLPAALTAVDGQTVSTFSNPDYPGYSARVKQLRDFCDNQSRSYSGYIDLEARHLFFYFFESRSLPEEDPVLLWLTGGPGCSSSLSAFMEMGPCNIHDAKGPAYNSYSWNTKTNLIFLDQPIGTGFSYAEHGEQVTRTEDGAEDIVNFVSMFFETFSQFKGRPFHIAGSSYGGRYIPVYASAIYDANRLAAAQGRTPINLQSILLGNGITDSSSMASTYYDMSCTNASLPPALPISTCVRMKQALPRCRTWIKAACDDHFDDISCNAAHQFCRDKLEAPFIGTGRNIYDMSQPCNGTIAETICYPLTKEISKWLDRSDVRDVLGVSEYPYNFTMCSPKVFSRFRSTLDMHRGSKTYVSELLERGIRVLVYVGNYDWTCNWLGNLAWTNTLQWAQGEEFAAKQLGEWTVDGHRAGLTKTAGSLTFATVDQAGHMASSSSSRRR
ncbi:peptidase S10, serine carboxypeptidase [Auriculariales sp. MPI-PUGE-AT-0066]|nr:peptidase S10, serine carboxypeptidase [Auriculariales sp. MPI-PUGE-AT-0066]